MSAGEAAGIAADCRPAASAKETAARARPRSAPAAAAVKRESGTMATHPWRAAAKSTSCRAQGGPSVDLSPAPGRSQVMADEHNAAWAGK